MDSEKERFIERLFKNEHKKLLVASQHMIGDYEEAEDLVQDVFALATLHCDKLMNHPKPAAWLMLTLHNLARGKNRFNQSHLEVSISEIEEIPDETEEQHLYELLPTTLSKEDREILIWRYEYQMDYKDIAILLGIAESSCRSRVSRAITRCKKLLL